jgi:hypothetical protein
MNSEPSGSLLTRNTFCATLRRAHVAVVAIAMPHGDSHDSRMRGRSFPDLCAVEARRNHTPSVSGEGAGEGMGQRLQSHLGHFLA